tara:strand:+ start:594 stop:2156 length:1563 start_codon:yes stop_codon:yes gene_type:complete
MNTINVCRYVSITNGKIEGLSANQYAIGTINNRTYSYIQDLRILANDTLYTYDASSLKKWGLDNIIQWMQSVESYNDDDGYDLRDAIDWFVDMCENNLMNITISNNLKANKIHCEYSDEITYSWYRGDFYTNDDDYCQMSANSLSDFWIDDYSNDWYSYEDFESLCTHDGDNISENTFENYFAYCESCDEIYHIDDEMIYSESDDVLRCEGCHDEHCESYEEELSRWDYTPNQLIFNYLNHNKNMMFKNLNSSNESNEKFGIELECEFNTDDVRTKSEIVRSIRNINDSKSFYCVNDGSLSDGVEIVSHPLSYDFIQNFDWNKIFRFRGDLISYNTDSCGIHVHINRDCMSVLQQYKFVQFFNTHSTFGFRISQRKKDNINKWSKFRDLLGDEFKKQLLYSYKSDLRNNNINYSKYKNIELGDKYYATNLKHSKTIEIRIFRGTLNKTSFLKNIEYVKSVKDWVCNSTTNNYLDFKSYWGFVQNSSKYDNLKSFVDNSESCKKAIQFPLSRIDGLVTRGY